MELVVSTCEFKVIPRTFQLNCRHLISSTFFFIQMGGRKPKSNIGDMNELEIKIGGTSFKMIYVEGGKYIMGAQNYDSNNYNYDSNAYPDEDPINAVDIKSFYIGRVPVTQMLWKKVMRWR